MYKQVLKNIRKSQPKNDLYKNVGTKRNSVVDRKPHFIISAENPFHQPRVKMNHEELLEFLQYKGYKAEEIKGKYGEEEKSILIHNPSNSAVVHLHRLARDLGQDSSLYSDGYNHELRFHGGPSNGQHFKGQGTDFPKRTPDDNYSILSDGTVFTHHLDTENLHSNNTSMTKNKSEPMRKSENYKGQYRPTLMKNEKKDHPLESAGPDTKLIHYSPTQGLKELDPSFHGVRKIGAEAKQGQPAHPMSFFYLSGTEPESIVTTGSKSKYVTSLGNNQLYDIGKDHLGLYQKLKEEAMDRSVNPGIVRKEDYHQAIKDAGFHGIYNSASGSMSNVVGMFGKMPIESEHKMHPNDYKIATTNDYNTHNEGRKDAKAFAEEQGHHNPNFLNKLNRTLK